jgi:Holliday junction resolvase RusA-like endonuclease
VKKIVFEICPLPKPRMVRSDTWAGRRVVAFYWEYKDHLNILARQKKYKIGDTLNIVFYLPMPDSWSEKKKREMNGKPHQQKPDVDNLLKGFTDALMAEDKNLYKVEISKYWAVKGQIEVFL